MTTLDQLSKENIHKLTTDNTRPVVKEKIHKLTTDNIRPVVKGKHTLIDW